jgi:phosphate transport system permease protein
MTDIAREGAPGHWSQSEATTRRLRRRYAAERRFRAYGVGAIALALGVLATLVATLAWDGHSAFVQTEIRIDVPLPADGIDPQAPGDANYRSIVATAMQRMFPDVTSRADRRALGDLVSSGTPYIIRDRVVEQPSLIGSTLEIAVPASDRLDQLYKGLVDRTSPEERRTVSDRQIAWFDTLVAEGRVSAPFNTTLFTSADSRFPELAGLKGAIVGSFFSLLVCLAMSFPIAIAAAIYLEEFAPRNRWTDLIEVNINNLAAVPSIVFGLLGLAFFLNFLDLPRSAPLVGGMVLSLMTLPTIIIAARASLKAVPPSIREAALGVGASHQQAVFHHVLPLAMPGIFTGTIIGMAQALGETAPLLLVGLNAFITAAPDSITSPSTVLPTQIYIWADSPERGFVARTAAAILVLLGFLVCMNAVAVFLRKRFERRW